MLNIALLGRQPKHCEFFFFPKTRITSILLDCFIEKFSFLGILTLMFFNILMNLKGGGQKRSVTLSGLSR